MTSGTPFDGEDVRHWNRRTPTTQKLADFTGVLLDLVVVVNMTTRYLDEGPHDIVVSEALWTTALIKYERCFNSSKRAQLPEQFDGLPPGMAAAHSTFRKMRDKHAAHSVNGFEQVQIGVRLRPAGEPGAAAMAIAARGHSLYAPGPPAWAALRTLALHFIGVARSLAEPAKDALLEELRDLPDVELWALPALPAVPLGEVDPAAARD